jgi:hypothetical protein
VHSVTETALRIIVEFLKREGVDAEFTESGARLGIGETTAHVETLKREEALHPAAPGELVQTGGARVQISIPTRLPRLWRPSGNSICVRERTAPPTLRFLRAVNNSQGTNAEITPFSGFSFPRFVSNIVGLIGVN